MRQRTPSDGKSSYCLWQGLLKRILKCEYLPVMYRINILHYISISYLSFNSLGKSYLSFNRVSEEKNFQKSINQKQELPVVAMFVNRLGQNEQSLQRTFHRCFLSSFGSFGQAVSEEKIFKNRPIRNKNCLWRPCLLMYRDKMSNLYRGPFIDASYQVSVHLAEGFQRRRL